MPQNPIEEASEAVRPLMVLGRPMPIQVLTIIPKALVEANTHENKIHNFYIANLGDLIYNGLKTHEGGR